MAIQTTFGKLSIGQCFSIGGNPESKHINIKIESSILANNRTGEPFNCIALEDGRVRTIHDDQKCFVRIVVAQ